MYDSAWEETHILSPDSVGLFSMGFFVCLFVLFCFVLFCFVCFYHDCSVAQLEVRDADYPRSSFIVVKSFRPVGFFVITDEFENCSF